MLKDRVLPIDNAKGVLQSVGSQYEFHAHSKAVITDDEEQNYFTIT